jgi:hypothetical protein
MDAWVHWLLAELAALEHQSGRLATASESV